MTDGAKIEYPTNESDKTKDLKARANALNILIAENREKMRESWLISHNALAEMGKHQKVVDESVGELVAVLKDLESEIASPRF